MLSRKKIALASLLLSGFAVAGVGVTQAHAGGPEDGCTRDAQANVTCKSEATYTSEDGKYQVHQTHECTSAPREDVNQPASGAQEPGTTQVGTVVECSNTAPALNNFVAPSSGR
ncbi:hypothetical protein [Streptomyces sp. NPDC060035]|uniref:hypothetical protein n=1 Tax=Streptomyces sp. NPDC060035 TaxID=3347044 RepID=UPI0036CB1C43